MSSGNNNELYPQDRLNLIWEASEKARKLSSARKALVADIVKGLSTKDPVRDFVLVSYNGELDEGIISRYQELEELPMRHRDKFVLVVQVAEVPGLQQAVCRTHLVRLRGGAVELDVQNQEVELPVHSGHMMYSESLDMQTMEGDWFLLYIKRDTIRCGPLINESGGISRAVLDTRGTYIAPQNASTEIFTDYRTNRRVSEVYGIHQESIQLLHDQWMIMQNRKYE